MPEYNIPMPKQRRGAKIKTVFEDLDAVGASKFFPCKEGQSMVRLQSNLFRLAHARTYLGFKVKTSQRIESGVEGVRVWRL